MNKYDINEQRRFNFELSATCAYFRRKVLKLTLDDLSKKSGIPISTLSSFEQGRSSNLRYIYVYLVSCETNEQKNVFINSIDQLLAGERIN